MEITVKEAAAFLLKNNNYVILAHASPDGDTLGSCHALCEGLQSLGKNAMVACADEISKRFMYLTRGVKNQVFTPETFISADVASETLLGAIQKEFSGRISLCIDHHVAEKEFAGLTWREPGSAAAAEMIYLLLLEMKVKLTDTMAACLYTGIATDTGCFRYANTNARTHRITAELMSFSFDVARLNYILFDMKSRARMKLEADIMSSMEYFCDDRAALCILTKEKLDSVDSEDVDGIAALPRQVEGVYIGISVKEKGEGVWKASFRSTEDADVQKICVALGGGGHKRAAGCKLNGTLAEVRARLIAETEKALAGASCGEQH